MPIEPKSREELMQSIIAILRQPQIYQEGYFKDLLVEAAYYNSPLQVAYILDNYLKNANILMQTDELPNEDINYVLHYAAEINDIELVKILVEHGADVNVQNINKQTPIYLT